MERRNKKPIIAICILTIIIVFVILIIVLMLNGKEKYTSINDTSATRQEILQCYTSTPINPFFVTPKNATEVKNGLKFLYNNDKISTSSFSYKASFPSAEIAKEELSKMQFNYYEYIGKTGLEVGDLNSVFNSYENTITISLYFENKDLVPEISDLLFLDKTEASKIQKYSIKELEKLYKNKSFSCEYQEYNHQN